MSDIKIEWKRYKPPGPFSTEGDWLFAGGWPLATYWNSGSRPRDDPKKIAIETDLPMGGKVYSATYVETKEEARKICERRVKHWLNILVNGADAPVKS